MKVACLPLPLEPLRDVDTLQGKWAKTIQLATQASLNWVFKGIDWLKDSSSRIVETVESSKSYPRDVGNLKDYPQNVSIHNEILECPAKTQPFWLDLTQFSIVDQQ